MRPDPPPELRVRVRVKPGARESRVLGRRNGELEIAVRAPPVDGAANRELLRVMARALGVAKSALEVVSGHAGRTKLVAVRGVSPAEIESLLP